MSGPAVPSASRPNNWANRAPQNNCMNEPMPAAVPAQSPASRIAPAWAFDRPIPLAKVMKKAGRKSVQSVSPPVAANSANAPTVAAWSRLPASTIVSTGTRPLNRPATRLPSRNPAGNSGNRKP